MACAVVRRRRLFFIKLRSKTLTIALKTVSKARFALIPLRETSVGRATTVAIVKIAASISSLIGLLGALAYFYFLQPMRSVVRSVREVVEGEGPYISRQIVAMSSRRCSSLSGSTSCRVTLITPLESISDCASGFCLCEFALDLFGRGADSICVAMRAPFPRGRRIRRDILSNEVKDVCALSNRLRGIEHRRLNVCGWT
jgi:hypothetical protein